MSKNIKTILGLIIAVLAVWGIYSITQKSGGPMEGEVIKIGVILPLSGDHANLGNGYRDGVLLAKDSLSGTKYNYEFIFEDDQMNSAKTVTALQKLISVDKIDMVMSFTSGPANVISPIAEQNKIIHFGIATDPNAAKGDYNFMHWTPPSEEAKTFVAELQKRGIKKFGIFLANQQGMISLIDAIRDQLKDTDIEIVTEQKFNMGQRDFRSLIAKAKSSESEIYLLTAFPPQLEILAKQIKEAGITTSFTSIEAFEFTEQMNLFEGEWYINAADSTNKFNDVFKQKYGKNPPLGAANGYDIINLFVYAYEEAGRFHSPLPKEIVKELNQIKNFKGALGTLNMGLDGIVFSKAVVRIIKDGKPVTISQ